MNAAIAAGTSLGFTTDQTGAAVIGKAEGAAETGDADIAPTDGAFKKKSPLWAIWTLTKSQSPLNTWATTPPTTKLFTP
jgi:hypothetical protein